MLNALRITLSLCVILFIKSAQAQTTDPIQGVAHTLVHINSLLDNGQSTKCISDIEDNQGDNESLTAEVSDIDEWSSAIKKSHSSKSGLELRAGYDFKFGDGSDEFYEDLYSYRNRLNVMLSWDMLNSGLFGKSELEQKVLLEAEQLKLKAQGAHYAELIYAQGEELSQMFDGYLNRVYLAKIEIYESLLTLVNNLHDQGHSTKIERAEIALQISMIKGLVKQTPFIAEHLLNFNNYIAKQLNFDSAAIDALVEHSSVVASSAIDEQLIRNEIDQNKYWKSITISPYAKAQHYSSTYFASSRVTANIGVTATLPLFSGNKNYKAELQAESKLVSNLSQRERQSLRITAGDVALQLNRNLEQLNALVSLEQLYRKQIELAEESYEHTQLTMRELAGRYIKLLSLHAQIIEQIESRESLKMKLMLTAI